MDKDTVMLTLVDRKTGHTIGGIIIPNEYKVKIEVIKNDKSERDTKPS